MSQELLDRFGRPLGSLRLSVTDRCNFRCRYCMPEEEYHWLEKPAILSFEELERVAGAFSQLGVTKLRLTGGEPLLRRQLPELVKRLSALGFEEIAITTNGSLLAPQAAALKAAGVTRFTVSLDTLRRERLTQLSRRDRLEQVLEGLGSVAHSPGLKIDTVLLRGFNDDEVFDLLDLAEQVGAELRFIEYMDVGGATRWSQDQVIPSSELLANVQARLGPLEVVETAAESPARRHRTSDGRVFGTISSVSEPFCAHCDRARLTADGRFLLCLYATDGLDLRALLRQGFSEEELKSEIADIWSRRTDRGAEQRKQLPTRGVFVPLESLRKNLHLEMHKRGG